MIYSEQVRTTYYSRESLVAYQRDQIGPIRLLHTHLVLYSGDLFGLCAELSRNAFGTGNVQLPAGRCQDPEDERLDGADLHEGGYAETSSEKVALSLGSSKDRQTRAPLPATGRPRSPLQCTSSPLDRSRPCSKLGRASSACSSWCR